MSGRFDYVRYDDESVKKSEELKADFVALTAKLEKLAPGRYSSLAITAIEESFMWVGKAIRDEQVSRYGAPAHQPQRGQ